MDSSETPPKIVGIGAATLDCLTLAEIPQPGAVHEADEIVFAGGGPVATALVAASRLGISTQLLDTFADDPTGQIITRELASEGVRITHERHATRSAIASILVSPQTGERSISFRPAESPPLHLTSSDKTAIAAAEILHMNGRHLEAATEAAQIAAEASTLISFDGGAGRFREEIAHIAFGADILIVAREFAEAACGETNDPSVLIERLAQRSRANLLVITDGARGSWILKRGNPVFHCKAIPVKSIVDTTGCGDCYHGVFLAGLISGKSEQVCAREASAAAALVAATLGGRAGLPDRPKLDAFLKASD